MSYILNASNKKIVTMLLFIGEVTKKPMKYQSRIILNYASMNDGLMVISLFNLISVITVMKKPINGIIKGRLKH